MTINIIQSKQTIIKINTTSGGSITTFSWKLDDVLQSNNTDTLTIPASTLSLGQHTVKFIGQNYCGNYSIEKTETLNVTDTSIPQPIIKNGSFDTDLNSWSFSTTGTGTAFNLNSEAVINMVTLGSTNKFIQTGLSLEANTNYRLKFDIYTANISKVNPYDIEFYLHDTYWGPPYPNGLIFAVDMSPTITKTTYEYSFNTNTPNPNYVVVPADITIRFKFMNTGIYYIDNVSIEKCPVPSCELKINMI